MFRVGVASTNIASVGWEPGPPPLIGTLEIEFSGGAVYQYDGVPPVEAFRVLLGDYIGPDGRSVGRAFHHLIRSKGYPYRRIE